MPPACLKTCCNITSAFIEAGTPSACQLHRRTNLPLPHAHSQSMPFSECTSPVGTDTTSVNELTVL